MKHAQVDALIRTCRAQRDTRPGWGPMETGPVTLRKGRFLWNLPADLLDATMAAGGHAAKSAMEYLWFEASQRRRLNGRPNPRWLAAVPCPSRPRRSFAGPRRSYLRGLDALERAQLIRRHPPKGRRLRRADILWSVE